MKQLLYKLLPKPFKNVLEYKVFFEYIGLPKEERYTLIEKRGLNQFIGLLLLMYSYFIISMQLFFEIIPKK